LIAFPVELKLQQNKNNNNNNFKSIETLPSGVLSSSVLLSMSQSRNGKIIQTISTTEAERKKWQKK